MKKIWSLLLCSFLVFSMTGCSSDDKDKDADKQTEKTDEKKDKKKEKKKDYFEIGETAEVEGVKITVNSTRIDPGDYITPEEGKEFVVLDIKLENTTDKDVVSSSIICYTLKDGDGRDQSMTIGASLNGSVDGTVPAGDVLSGEVAFEVDQGNTLMLTFRPGFGDSVKIKIR